MSRALIVTKAAEADILRAVTLHRRPGASIPIPGQYSTDMAVAALTFCVTSTGTGFSSESVKEGCEICGEAAQPESAVRTFAEEIALKRGGIVTCCGLYSNCSGQQSCVEFSL